ncbi:ABC transporter permease [Arcobacter sp. KX21116]|jgi:peptide/nickel transport system permease protein|uniref:ABC transporter permease n=1 Tax=Arcobacter iocasae TaxID=2906515 RepID=UPI0035D4BC8A
MKKIIISRITQVLMLVLLISTISFIMMQLLPGDPALKIAAGRYGPDGVTAEIAQSVRMELGLDKSMFQAYLDSLYQLFKFDLGYSLISGEKVIHEIQTQMGYSLYLAFFSFLLSLIFAIPLGIYSGAKNNGIIDKLGFFFSILFRAIPPFILGLLLMYIFSIYFRILPPAGFENWKYLVLPSLTLALGLAAVSNRLIKESMLEVSNSSYYAYGKYKGLTDLTLINRHGIRNASISVIAYLGLQSIYLIEGVVIVESIYAFPGIGHALVHAVIARDIPMIQGTVLVMGLFFILINFFTDMITSTLDPRLRIKNA